MLEVSQLGEAKVRRIMVKSEIVFGLVRGVTKSELPTGDGRLRD